MTTRRVLLIEDEEVIREVVREVLLDEGFEVIAAASGEQALNALQRDGIQIILTDINMPGRFDGIEVAAFARRSHPALPVVFITGRPNEAERALRIGKPCVLVKKPFDLDHLMEMVRRVLPS
jgi:CheY-like chemotaxis protein